MSSLLASSVTVRRWVCVDIAPPSGRRTKGRRDRPSARRRPMRTDERPQQSCSSQPDSMRLPCAPGTVWPNTRMGACAPHSAGQRNQMRFLVCLEHTMERWSTTVWQSLVPRQRKQAEVVGILRRECDDRALILDRRRTLVPNTFVIELPPESHRQLTDDSAQVAGHLAAQVRRHAAEQGYTFAGPVAVHLAPADDAGVGRFRIRSHISPLHR
ncbi:DUF3662 domain-containing protein [Streptomyces phaeochromogenes]|uniref:DUF3662 domain-containing protein n=1 Tax=Streptomyces phaeochromogenes TaxID=1923 RepID=UPI00398CA409